MLERVPEHDGVEAVLLVRAGQEIDGEHVELELLVDLVAADLGQVLEGSGLVQQRFMQGMQCGQQQGKGSRPSRL